MAKTDTSGGLSAEERDAVKQRSKELREQEKAGKNRAAGEKAVLDAIDQMEPDDKVLAEGLNKVVTEVAPDLVPKTYYADHDAVTGVDLVAAGGKRLVLTGPTGSGKSTVLAALMRTLDPRAGAVLVDDVDARDVRSDDVRARIAWCGPSTHLFDSTLRQNLQLARPGAADGELVAALCRAGLRSWLDRLPAGLGTRSAGARGGVGPGGGGASGSPARCWPTGRCCCSTSRPPTSTPAPRPGCAPTCCRATTGRTAVFVTRRPEELPGLPQVRLPARQATAPTRAVGYAPR